MPNEKFQEIRAMRERLRGDARKLEAEIGAIRHRLEGLDMALSVFEKEQAPAPRSTGPRIRRRLSNKTMVLDMLDKAGPNGLSVVEMLNQNSRFKRGTISSQLSHWAKDGIVINAGGRYYLRKYPHPSVTKTEPVLVPEDEAAGDAAADSRGLKLVKEG